MIIEFPSEKAIEDYVWKKLQETDHCPISHEYVSFFARQKEIKGYGITDIIKVLCPGDTSIEVVVMELKNETLKESHVSQLYRYMTGIRRIADLYSSKLPDCPEITVRGELAGPLDKDRGDCLWLFQSLQDITVYDLSMSFESGFQVNELRDGWHSTAESRLSYKDEVRKIANANHVAEKLFLEQLRASKGHNVVRIGGDNNAKS